MSEMELVKLLHLVMQAREMARSGLAFDWETIRHGPMTTKLGGWVSNETVKEWYNTLATLADRIVNALAAEPPA